MNHVTHTHIHTYVLSRNSDTPVWRSRVTYINASCQWIMPHISMRHVNDHTHTHTHTFCHEIVTRLCEGVVSQLSMRHVNESCHINQCVMSISHVIYMYASCQWDIYIFMYIYVCIYMYLYIYTQAHNNFVTAGHHDSLATTSNSAQEFNRCVWHICICIYINICTLTHIHIYTHTSRLSC